MLQTRLVADEANTASGIRVSHDLLIVAATALIAVLGYFFTEKIPIANGLGWDGKIYGELAKGALFQTDENPLDRYTIRRVLPSAMVCCGLKLCRLSLNDENVIHGFGLLNILCVTSVGWCWVRIAKLMAIGSRGKWLGFCALILNFAVVKHTSYYPVLTDMPAFAIGCGMLYLYMLRRFWSLLILTIIGAFVWPTMMFQGTLLLLFPRESRSAEETIRPTSSQSSPFGLNFWFAGLATYYLLFAIYWSVGHANLPICGYIDPAKQLLPLSMGIVAVYIFFVLYRMIDVVRCAEAIRTLLTRDCPRLIAVCLMIAAVKFAYSYLAPLSGHNDGKLYLLRLFIKAVYKPGIFLVGHAVYFGPIVPLIVLLWTSVSREIQKTGVGISLAVTLALLLSLDGESRHLDHAFPLVVPFAIRVIERLNWDLRRTLSFVTLSAFASKFWWTINQPDFETGFSLLEFPLQSYAMNYGVFMNTQTYLIQGLFAIAITGLLATFVSGSGLIQGRRSHQKIEPSRDQMTPIAA
ncbi:MAG: hypothetical protein JWP89_4799 [Schlesneria sp.]|nr:hypothetical protein [Schlesneria sp.]